MAMDCIGASHTHSPTITSNFEIILSSVGVTIDGVSIGDSIY
jgi:hypothetical protein